MIQLVITDTSTQSRNRYKQKNQKPIFDLHFYLGTSTPFLPRHHCSHLTTPTQQQFSSCTHASCTSLTSFQWPGPAPKSGTGHQAAWPTEKGLVIWRESFTSGQLIPYFKSFKGNLLLNLYINSVPFQQEEAFQEEMLIFTINKSCTDRGHLINPCWCLSKAIQL